MISPCNLSLIAHCSLLIVPRSSILSPSLGAIQDLVTHYGWWGVLFLMFLQGTTLPVPNEITMPLAGWLLVHAAGRSKAFIAFAGFVGATGWMLGALVAYTVMAVGGRPLLMRLRRRSAQVERALAISDRWFARWGAWAAFIARLLPVSRVIITLPAGASRVPVVPFALATFAGAFIWSTFLAALGYIAGSQWERARTRLGQWYAPAAIGFVVLAVAAYVVIGRVRERHRSPLHRS